MSKQTIKWENIKVGDKFEDGSTVTSIEPEVMNPCYTVTITDGNGNSNEMILSGDHVLQGEAYIDGYKISAPDRTMQLRELLQCDDSWICVSDIYNICDMGGYVLCNSKRVTAKPYKDLEPQPTFCISTDTGYYMIDGIYHHNTARKLFYAFSDMMVYDDCGGPYIDAMHCKAPEGHVCQKCANLTKGGEGFKAGDFIGGRISTNISEPLTQLSMKQMHSITDFQKIKIVKRK